MTTSTVIPKHVEEVLNTHRRGFLKSAGLLVVSFATGGAALVTEAAVQNSAATQPAAVLIQIRISINSTRGSLFMRTTRRPFMSAKRTLGRVPAPVFGN